MTNYVTPEFGSKTLEISEREKTSSVKSSHNGRDFCDLTEEMHMTDYSEPQLCGAKKATTLSEQNIVKKETSAHSNSESQADSEFIYSQPTFSDALVGCSDTEASGGLSFTDSPVAFSNEARSSEEQEFGSSPGTQATIRYDEVPILTERPRKPENRTARRYDELQTHSHKLENRTARSHDELRTHSHKPEKREAISYDEPPAALRYDEPPAALRYGEPPVFTVRSRKQKNAPTRQNTQEKIQRSTQEKFARAKTKLSSALRRHASSGIIAAEFIGAMMNGSPTQAHYGTIERKPLSSDYIAEAMDGHYFPNHPAVIEARQAWLQTEGDESFEEWLDARPEVSQQLASVQYLNDKERKKFEVNIQNGQLMRGQAPYGTAQETTVFSGQGTAIFVLSGRPQLYAGSHIAGQFHHSSFLSGQPVLAAGELKTDANGNLVAISNKSGHYKPGIPENLMMLEFLKKSGVNLGSVVYDEVLPSNIICRHQTAEIYFNSKGLAVPPEMFDRNFHVTISSDDSGRIIVHETRNTATPETTQNLHRATLIFLKSKGVDLDNVTFIRHNAPPITDCNQYMSQTSKPR